MPCTCAYAHLHNASALDVRKCACTCNMCRHGMHVRYVSHDCDMRMANKPFILTTAFEEPVYAQSISVRAVASSSTLNFYLNLSSSNTVNDAYNIWRIARRLVRACTAQISAHSGVFSLFCTDACMHTDDS